MAQEVEVMRRFIPTYEWLNPANSASLLVRDFLAEDAETRISRGEDGIRVAKYGPISIWMRLRPRQDMDSVRRRGMILESSETSIAFDRNALKDCRLQYFVRTMAPQHGSFLVDHDIDYGHEQRLMKEVARMLYAGLYGREYENQVKMNKFALRIKHSDTLPPAKVV